MRIKTKAIKFDSGDGNVVKARGVILTPLNWQRALDWSNGEGKVTILKDGTEKNHRIRLHTPKGIRVAKVGDSIVKVGRGEKASFYVLKYAV